MTTIPLTRKTLDLSVVATSSASFAKGFGAITVAQTALAITRIPQVSAALPLSEGRLVEVRRGLGILASMVIPVFFFKDKNMTFSSFLKNNPIFVFTCVLNFIGSFQPCLPKSLEKKDFSIPDRIVQIGRVIYALWTSLVKHTQLKTEPTVLHAIWNHAIVPAVTEEVVFRGVIQEVVFKQIPKMVLKILTGSTDGINHPIAKCLRIIASALIFGFAHLYKHTEYSKTDLTALLQITSGGLREAAFTESLGLASSILAHYSLGLYVLLAQIEDFSACMTRHYEICQSFYVTLAKIIDNSKLPRVFVKLATARLALIYQIRHSKAVILGDNSKGDLSTIFNRYLSQGKLDEATTWLENHNMGEDSQRVWIEIVRAFLYEGKIDHAKAASLKTPLEFRESVLNTIKKFEHRISSDPKDPNIFHEGVALFCMSNKKFDKARDAAQKIPDPSIRANTLKRIDQNQQAEQDGVW